MKYVLSSFSHVYTSIAHFDLSKPLHIICLDTFCRGPCIVPIPTLLWFGWVLTWSDAQTKQIHAACKLLPEKWCTNMPVCRMLKFPAQFQIISATKVCCGLKSRFRHGLHPCSIVLVQILKRKTGFSFVRVPQAVNGTEWPALGFLYFHPPHQAIWQTSTAAQMSELQPTTYAGKKCESQNVYGAYEMGTLPISWFMGSVRPWCLPCLVVLSFCGF